MEKNILAQKKYGSDYEEHEVQQHKVNLSLVTTTRPILPESTVQNGQYTGMSLKKRGLANVQSRFKQIKAKQRERYHEDDGDDWAKFTPEHNLVRAVVQRAVNDYRQVYGSYKGTEDKTYRFKAGNWIYSNEYKPFSFLWCLDFLVDEPEKAARLIRKELEIDKSDRKKNKMANSNQGDNDVFKMVLQKE